MTDLLLGAAMPNACPRPDWDGRETNNYPSVRCDVVFGAVSVQPNPGNPPENWLYRQLRLASERVSRWPKSKRDAIVYTLEAGREQDRTSDQ